MGPKKLKERLVQYAKKGYPVLIKGAPGVGKSDIVEQAAKEIDYDMIITHPVVSDPTDFKGQPCVVEGKDGKKRAEFLPFGDLRKMMYAKHPTIVFIDDLGQAPAAVQAACMQLLLARQINGKKISDNITFLAATNRRQDRAGVTGILEPVKSRFYNIYELQPEKDDWIEWALAHDMPEEVIGFVNFRPDLLCTEEATSDIVNHPCPRTLAHAGDTIKMGLTSMEDLSGVVGEGCAVELTGFMKVFRELPSIDAIIMDPDSAPVPTDPSAQYAVVAALVGKVSKQNVKRIFQYGYRMPGPFSILLAKDSIRKDKEIQHTKTFIEWCQIHSDVLL